jgi:hypothetical protein
MRRTAGTPSQSESESEEEKGPKSPEPSKSPKFKSPEVKPSEVEPSEVEPSEANLAEPAQTGDKDDAKSGEVAPGAGAGQEKKARKPHGPGYVNKDRHKTGGERVSYNMPLSEGVTDRTI